MLFGFLLYLWVLVMYRRVHCVPLGKGGGHCSSPYQKRQARISQANYRVLDTDTREVIGALVGGLLG